MSNPNALSVRNGGESFPISFQGESADANARLIAAAPDLYAALNRLLHDSMYKDHPEASEMAIAALKKANGGKCGCEADDPETEQ